MLDRNRYNSQTAAMPNCINNSATSDLINGIQQQVARFVFSKVSQQIDNLEQIDTATNRQTHQQFPMSQSNFSIQQPVPSISYSQTAMPNPHLAFIPPSQPQSVAEAQPYLFGNLNYPSPGNIMTHRQQPPAEILDSNSGLPVQGPPRNGTLNTSASDIYNAPTS